MNEEKLKMKLENEFKKQEQFFGKGKFYQSFPRLNIEGMRPTDERIQRYKIQEFVKKTDNVLDLGCNCGFFDLSVAEWVSSVTGIEYNEALVAVGNMAKDGLKIENVNFVTSDYESWRKKNKKKFDVIFSFAVHYWFKVKPYHYAKDLSKMLNKGGFLFFESQDIKGDKDYPNFLNEFKCRGFKEVFNGGGKDDGEYERNFFVLKRQETNIFTYVFNKIKSKFPNQKHRN